MVLFIFTFEHSLISEPWTCSKTHWLTSCLRIHWTLVCSQSSCGLCVWQTLSEWVTNGRKHNSLPLDIWLRLIIEKDSCLFIDLSSVPYFWALFFSFSLSIMLNYPVVMTQNTYKILHWGGFSNTVLTHQSSFAVISHCFRIFLLCLKMKLLWAIES